MLDPCVVVSVAQRNSIDKIRDAFVMERRREVPMTQWDDLRSMIRILLHDCVDRVVWDLEATGNFSISSARKFLDTVCLGAAEVKTRWNAFVPLKLNILLWRIAKDRIPTRLNLCDRGIDLDMLLCPGCSTIGESANHLFAMCPEVVLIWHRIAMWWGVTVPMHMSISALIGWVDEVALSLYSKQSFDTVIIVTVWMICCFRNKLLFSAPKLRKEDLFDEICLLSYFCINNRHRKCKMSWDRRSRAPSLAFNIM
ncbi:hypothetical protein LXL04_027853 [Taraxacum kok-saghyz]